MNTNEVIAQRALEILGTDQKEGYVIHPNDHVNLCQSSNDVFPTAIHIAAHGCVSEVLLPALRDLQHSLREKSREFSEVVKAGRTHLQDAAPVTLGQEFSAYAKQIEYSFRRLRTAASGLCRVALGGTAVGTGLNAHPEFASRVLVKISERVGVDFSEAQDHLQAQSELAAILDISAQLRTCAIGLLKMLNDIRWSASGPRCGLGEISLPEVQAGSSSMPGKTNPVICESTMMACVHALGSDCVVAQCGQHGNFELNTMMPIAAYHLLSSIEILGNSVRNFSERCVRGIAADAGRCRIFADQSLAAATALVPIIGYDRAAELARRALQEDRSLQEVAEAAGVGSRAELARIFDPLRMARGE
jgi:fumarate hydratase class II